MNGKSLARVTLANIVPFLKRLQRPFLLHLRLDPTALHQAPPPPTTTPPTPTAGAGGGGGGVAVDDDGTAAASAAAGAGGGHYRPIPYTFHEPTAGIRFRPNPSLSPLEEQQPATTTPTSSLAPPLVVAGFASADCLAARSGVVRPGQLLLAVNGAPVVGLSFEAALARLKDPARPMRLDLGADPDVEVVVEGEGGGSLDLEVALFRPPAQADAGVGEASAGLGEGGGRMPLVVVTGLVANRLGKLVGTA